MPASPGEVSVSNNETNFSKDCGIVGHHVEVSYMTCLIIAEGTPLGVKIGQTGNFTLCEGKIFQTAQHALFDCPAVSAAWACLRHMRILGLSWDSALLGDLGTPRTPDVTDSDMTWDTGATYTVNEETPSTAHFQVYNAVVYLV